MSAPTLVGAFQGRSARVPRRPAALAVAACAAVVVLAPVAAATGRSGSATVRPARAVVDPGIAGSGLARPTVIVQALPGRVAAAESAVRRAGGTVVTALPIVDGFEAVLTPRAVATVAGGGDVVAITLDRVGHFDTMSYDGGTTSSNFVRTSGAATAWAAGNYGSGVGVAVIDSGVSPMDDTAGRVVRGPDLSGEGTVVDSYGHGTVMGSIIAGNGADSGGQYMGVAPQATLVAVKVAGRTGAVDVSTILQAMHWVAAYRAQYNIRVLNLSYGVPSTQNPSVDPLDYAVERLWKQGIVVVVSAGNSGPQSGTITKPGDDPIAITVGAYDDKQNTDPSDDSVASWSSEGPTAAGTAKPDVVASGRYVIAQRSYGSWIEQNYPKALYAPSYIRGSGTSEATAVTSGAVALLEAANPRLTPDQVKAVLKSTASPISGFTAFAQGAGRIQLDAAITAAPGPPAWQLPAAGGLGSLDASRGGLNVTAACPGQTSSTVIQGEIDVRCEAWNGAAWTGAAWTGAAWTGAAWTGAAWTGAAWTGAAWTGGTWSGGSWQGAAWTGAAWTGSAWTGAAWTGAAWTGAAWTGAAWTGAAWTSAGYDDVLLTAFWGNHPAWWQHLPGEISDPPPPPAGRSTLS